MKKLAGLVIILAVLVLGAYYAMGLFTEKAIRKNIQAINQSKGVSAEIKDYQKNLFSSQSNIKWQLHVPARIIKDTEGKPQVIPAQDIQSDMPLKIYHGPVIFADKKLLFGMGYATAILPLPDQYSQQFDTLFDTDSIKPWFHMSIFVNYLNKSTLKFNVPPFKLISKDKNASLNWMGLASTTSIYSGHYDGSLILEGLSFNKNDLKLSLTGLNTDYDFYKNPNGLFLGNLKFSLPSLNITNKDQKIFELNTLKLSSDSDIDKNLFSTHLSLTFKSIDANNKTYGPGTFEISLRNIDAEVLAKLNAQAKELQNSPEADQKRIMFSMLPEFPKLFINGAELEVTELKLKLPEGMVKGSLLITLPKDKASGPFDLFQKIQGNAKLKMPKDVLNNLIHQSILQQLTKQQAQSQGAAQQAGNNASINKNEHDEQGDKSSELNGQTNKAQDQPVNAEQSSQADKIQEDKIQEDKIQADKASQASQVNQSQQDSQIGKQTTSNLEQLARVQTDKQIASLEQSGVIISQGTDYSIEVTLENGKFSVNGKPYDASMPIRF